MGDKIFTLSMAVLIFSCAWNVFAILFHLVGIDLPVIDVLP